MTQGRLFNPNPTYRIDARLAEALRAVERTKPNTWARVEALRNVNGVCNDIDTAAWNAAHPEAIELQKEGRHD